MRNKHVTALMLAMAMLLGASHTAQPSYAGETATENEPAEAVTEADFTDDLSAEASTEPSDDFSVEASTDLSDDSAAAAGEFELDKPKGLHLASDYEEVYKTLKEVQPHWLYATGAVEDAEELIEYDAAPALGAASETSMEKVDAAADSSDFSTTNLRDTGVDEGDIIKTDGEYIYILKESDRSLHILRASGTYIEAVSRSELDDAGDGAEFVPETFYVDHDKLIVVGTEYQPEDPANDTYYGYYYSDAVGSCHTKAVFYDISDRSAPVCEGSAFVDGRYNQSRKVGDVLYLYGTCSPLLEETYEESSLVPVCGGGDGAREIEAERIILPDHISQPAYLVIGSVRLDDPNNIADVKVLAGGQDQLYVTPQSIYAFYPYYENREKTEIVRIACEDGNIKEKAGCRISGYVKDTFCIDEYDGHLRVLSTYTGYENDAMEWFSQVLGMERDSWTTRNALYVMDDGMNTTGKITSIARGETIRSARYFGDMAWFVTYENTDPLFTADLSDPENPVLTGKLEITGYSEYLHPYGENRLLGIGYETDPDTGQTMGVKLSMFDLSNPEKVTETGKTIIPGITYLPALNNYKALLVSPDKNLIGFFCEDRYLLYRYEEGSFRRCLLYDFFADGLAGKVSSETVRGLYIGDTFYAASEEMVIPFDMAYDFARGDRFTLE